MEPVEPAAPDVPLQTYCELVISEDSRVPLPFESSPADTFVPPLAQLTPAASFETVASVKRVTLTGAGSEFPPQAVSMSDNEKASVALFARTPPLDVRERSLGIREFM